MKGLKAIDKLFKEGKSFSHFPLRVVFLETIGQSHPLQAGFTVSNRHFKNAVDRNRIKRLMRESYRLQKNSLRSELVQSNKCLAVFFIYTSNQLPKYREVFEKTGGVLQRLLQDISK